MTAMMMKVTKVMTRVLAAKLGVGLGWVGWEGILNCKTKSATDPPLIQSSDPQMITLTTMMMMKMTTMMMMTMTNKSGTLNVNLAAAHIREHSFPIWRRHLDPKMSSSSSSSSSSSASSSSSSSWSLTSADLHFGFLFFNIKIQKT